MAGRTAAAAGSCCSCWRSQQCSAPSQSPVLCCLLCLTLTEKQNTGMERSGPTPSALCLASLPCGSGTGGAPTAAADRHRCCTGAGHMYVLVCICLLSTSFAADFWPGLERASEGLTAGRGIAFYASRHRLRAWPGLGGRGARSWTLSLLFYASRRQLRAWPGWGGGGVRCLGMELAFLSFTHLPLDRRPSYAQSLVPTPSKTVDQTLPQ